MPAIWPTSANTGSWPFTDGQLVDEDDLNQALTNLDDLNTRIGTGTGTDIATRVAALETGKVPTTRTLTAGSGLTGGGDLSANRTFAVDFGNGATQVATGARALALENGASASHAIRAVLTADQSIANANATVRVTWPTPVYNTGITVSDSNRTFTTTKAGKYALTFALRFDQSNIGTERAGWIALASDANTRYVSWGVEKPTSSTYWPYLGASTVVSLASGVALSVYAYQDSGAALNLKQFGGNCNFSITYLGP